MIEIAFIPEVSKAKHRRAWFCKETTLAAAPKHPFLKGTAQAGDSNAWELEVQPAAWLSIGSAGSTEGRAVFLGFLVM